VLARPNGKSRKKPQHSARNKTAPAGEENVANGFPARKQTETSS
jgi:hypothetical protein